jgi:NADH-quinone oxidoreductase subunit N
MDQLTLPHVAWDAILPEIILVVGGIGILVAGALFRRLHQTVFTVLTLAVTSGALLATQRLWHGVTSVTGPRQEVADAIVVDGFSLFLIVTICVSVFLAVLVADGYLRREGLRAPDFYVLILLSASGAALMAAANDLIVIFLGIEILSIALYVLAGFHGAPSESERAKRAQGETRGRRRDQSLEAAIKYFVLGSFSSAFLLYGIALTYGVTGSTNLTSIATFLRTNVVSSGTELAALAMLAVGLGFKVAAVPFHMWTPDVYQGSPTPVTGFMAAAAKAAGFAALLRVAYSAFGSSQVDWQPVIWALAVLSLVVGSVLAVVQTDVKRMLAYSSISHAGYVLVGLQAATDRGISGSLFYLLAYAFMIVGSFAVVTLVARRGDEGHTLDDYRGLSTRRPGLALLFTIFLLAQAGVPLTSGFLAKFAVISAAVASGSYALAVIAMLAAVIAAFFYLRVIVVMYMSPEGESAPTSRPVIPVGAGAALGLAVAFTVVVGILPSSVLDFARHATILRF